ncbi:MAG: hypothetical protein JNM56_39045 [Planctomycetia bacterium]|nr:hypothetical protein [Planctomycetia bacterium]
MNTKWMILLGLVPVWFSGTALTQEPPAKKPKFDIPVWHPDARWEVSKEPFAGNLLVPGELDGPRREVMWMTGVKPTLLGGLTQGERHVVLSYDARTERFFQATRGARGYLDGPFARARFKGGHYHESSFWVHAPDGRFFYLLEAADRLRAVDFAKQYVSTVPTKGAVKAMTCGESGKLYVVLNSPATEVQVLSSGSEWKLLETVKLQGKQELGDLGSVLAVDEERGRLYGTTYGAWPWYVWYWNLKDGSYHGVLPNAQKEADKRKQGEAGPFAGTVVYNHGAIAWGPDDPEKRFLYMTRVDDSSCYRLDLDEKVLRVFNEREGRFIEKGRGTPITYAHAPFWFDDGSFSGWLHFYPGETRTLARRIK